MTAGGFEIRAIRRADYDGWRPLWDGYNAFYGPQRRHRVGGAHHAGDVGALFRCRGAGRTPWSRNREGKVMGLAHYLFHRSTTRLRDVCYLQDLFTASELRRSRHRQEIGSLVFTTPRVPPDAQPRAHSETACEQPARTRALRQGRAGSRFDRLLTRIDIGSVGRSRIGWLERSGLDAALGRKPRGRRFSPAGILPAGGRALSHHSRAHRSGRGVSVHGISPPLR